MADADEDFSPVDRSSLIFQVYSKAKTMYGLGIDFDLMPARGPFTLSDNQLIELDRVLNRYLQAYLLRNGK